MKLFQGNFPLCIWCFSHQLEQSLYDVLTAYMDPTDTTLMHLYYLYEKSSKKTCELKVLFDELKEVCEIDGKVLKPIQVVRTHWVDHKLKVMSCLISNFGVYMQHLQNVIADTSKKYDQVTVKGKYDKLVDAMQSYLLNLH